MAPIGDGRADRQTTAVRNNAAWCDTVCRALGLPTTRDEELWTVEAAPPRFYPDVITLRPDVAVDRVLSAVAGRPSAGVKDSFARLDLQRRGFRELFAARWLYRPADTAPPRTEPTGAGRADTKVADAGLDREGWTVVRDPAGLAAWSHVTDSVGVFDPDLLDARDVSFLARHDGGGRIVAGAILNRAAEAVGISNVFPAAPPAGRADRAGRAGRWESPWPAVVAWAGRMYPGHPLVGYEGGADLDAARSSGFADAGGLRIWVRDPAVPAPSDR